MTGRPPSGFWISLAGVALAGFLAGCSAGSIPKDLKPVPRALTVAMHEQGMDEKAPIFIRIFKEESQLEVWKRKTDGTYAMLKSYDICQWSGELGPKKVEGDRQAPEGFYTVTPAQMNPNSDYYLSFNIGYPNAYDQSLGRTGGNLMVHGACSSAGCYSMTDESAGEIFALARDAFTGGQREFQIQAFPFKMTAENMARHYNNPNIDFWRMLKVGYDSFELTRTPPKVDVCDRRYVFDAETDARFSATAKCPYYVVAEPLKSELAKKQAEDDAQIVSMVVAMRNGAPPPGPTVTAAPAPKTSLVSRLGMGGKTDPAPVAATPVSLSPSSSAPVSVAPRAQAPVASSAPTPLVPATSKPAVTAAAPASVPANQSKPTDPIGTLIERKFWWDDAPPAGAPG